MGAATSSQSNESFGWYWKCLYLAGLRIERYDGCYIEVVAGALVAHPWATIAGAQ